MKEGQYKRVVLLYYPTFRTYMVFKPDDRDYCKSCGGLLCHFEAEHEGNEKVKNLTHFRRFWVKYVIVGVN